MKDRYILCYVDNNCAYFTTQRLEEQWGDDWDDAPYEHNAGEPYEPCWHNKPGSSEYPCDCELCKKDWNKDGSPKWKIYKLYFEVGYYRSPASDYTNSPHSVRDINKGSITPWIRFDDKQGKQINIYAGTRLSEFIKIIKENGGKIFTESRQNCIQDWIYVLFFDNRLTGFMKFEKDGTPLSSKDLNNWVEKEISHNRLLYKEELVKYCEENEKRGIHKKKTELFMNELVDKIEKGFKPMEDVKKQLEDLNGC